MVHRGKKYLDVGRFITYMEDRRIGMSESQFRILCDDASEMFGLKITVENAVSAVSSDELENSGTLSGFTGKGRVINGVIRSKVRPTDFIITEHPNGRRDIVRFRKKRSRP